MATPTIIDVKQVSDPLLPFQYSMQFASVKGSSGASVGDFTLRCYSTSKPGRTIEIVPVDFPGGHTINFAGGTNFSRTWTTEMWETSDAGVRKRIISWYNYIRNIKTSIGTFKQMYSTSVIIEQYNNASEVVEKIKMNGVFPTDMTDSALSASDKGTAMTTSITWSFDDWDYV